MFTDTTQTTAYLLPERQTDGTHGARIFPVIRRDEAGPVLRDPLTGDVYHADPAELAGGIPLDARTMELIEAHGRAMAADALGAALDRLNSL